MSSPSSTLEALAVRRLSEAVSGRLVLDQLLETIMRVVMETSGAHRGCFISLRAERAFLAAEAVASPQLDVKIPAIAELSPERVPISVVNYVRRRRERVILADAASANPFSADSYFARRRPRSAAGLPIVRQAELIGMLYLENDTTAQAFTPERVAMLELLTTYAAIALENSELYADLHRKQQALGHSQEFLQAVIDSSDAIIDVKDLSGHFVLVNRRFEELFHVDRKSLAGKTDFDVFPRDRAEAFRAFDQRVIQAGRALKAEEIAPLDDGPHTYITVKCPLRDEAGRPYAICGISTDITEWKRAQDDRETLLQQLEQERARLGAILNLMPIPMLLIEPDTARVLFSNKAAESMGIAHLLRTSAGAAPPRCTDAQGRAISAQNMPDKRAARREKLVDFEMAWDSPTGRRCLLINSETLEEARAQPGAIVLTFQEVSRLKQVEEQLRQSQKMEVVGQLAGGIAHDFNNLLTAIIGYSELALSETDPSLPISASLREIRDCGQRAASLTQQLLAFGRKQILQPKVLELNRVVTGMEKMVRRLIGEDLQLEIVTDPYLPRIKADPGQIEQAVLNLVLNARDAMPRGGQLYIGTQDVLLTSALPAEPATVPPGHYVRLRVRDTGSGIEPHIRAHIFEPFFTTKGVGKGTGLGLSTVYGVVTQSNGFVTVSSEPGRGAVFDLYLPAFDETQKTPDSNPPRASPGGGSETILLVEDDAQVRTLTRQMLERNGYTVAEASNGVEALALCKKQSQRIDLILTDVVMPEMGGRELAEKALQVRPGTRLIYMSGYTNDAIVRHGLDQGRALLEKPFTAAKLLSHVREALDGAPSPKT